MLALVARQKRAHAQYAHMRICACGHMLRPNMLNLKGARMLLCGSVSCRLEDSECVALVALQKRAHAQHAHKRICACGHMLSPNVLMVKGAHMLLHGSVS